MFFITKLFFFSFNFILVLSQYSMAFWNDHCFDVSAVCLHRYQPTNLILSSVVKAYLISISISVDCEAISELAWNTKLVNCWPRYIFYPHMTGRFRCKEDLIFDPEQPLTVINIINLISNQYFQNISNRLAIYKRIQDWLIHGVPGPCIVFQVSVMTYYIINKKLLEKKYHQIILRMLLMNRYAYKSGLLGSISNHLTVHRYHIKIKVIIRPSF